MKRLLVVVDYQNDFVCGSLGFDKAKELEDHIVYLIKEYRMNGDEVIYTMDTHQSNYLETYEGKHLPIEHCIEHTEGWQIYGKVKDLLQDSLCFKKNTFPSLDLAYYLEDKKYKDITFVGLVSNICVISNAIMAKAAQCETPIRVDLKGIGSSDEKAHQACIEVMKSLQIEIIE
ncbi:MAG: cysteine hydrolase family protein [Erysipelotrichaceae bacterium]|nr:cysteine hydrolase family protein [Erysipelotrichaceae bacterium]